LNGATALGRAAHVVFDDVFDTGVYTWKYLYEVSVNLDARWQAYLDALERLGQGREPKGRSG
jgi:DUF971 family protein